MSAQLAHLLQFVAGFALLVGGAELLVRGGVGLARHLGVSPVVVGLTVVAFGTSAPELVVSLAASMRGSPDLTTGNVVGSNLANSGLVLGVAGLLRPLPVALRLLRLEVPALVAATVAFSGLALDGSLGRADGLLLLGAIVLLTAINIRAARQEGPLVVAEFETAYGPVDGVWRDTVATVVGLALLIGGGHLLVEASVAIARGLGISELLIGLTLVAVGTSLPELATAIVAVRHDEPDIAVGNVVGSNLFNLLAVIGPVAAISPVRVSAELLRVQVPALLMVTGLLWLILRSKRTVRRSEAAVLLVAYGAIIALSATS